MDFFCAQVASQMPSNPFRDHSGGIWGPCWSHLNGILDSFYINSQAFFNPPRLVYVAFFTFLIFTSTCYLLAVIFQVLPLTCCRFDALWQQHSSDQRSLIWPRRDSRSANNPPALWAWACKTLRLLTIPYQEGFTLPVSFPDWPPRGPPRIPEVRKNLLPDVPC